MAERHDILIVEDSPALSATYAAYLRAMDLRIHRAASLAEAQDILQTQTIDLQVVDLKLPDGDGMSLIATASETENGPQSIVITADGSVERAVDAMRAGASDFLAKPFDGNRLRTTVRNALEQRRLSRILRHYESSFREEGFEDFIGRSLPMQALYNTIVSAARSSASVFITGESGTGKELCAQALHRRSPRAGRPLIALNCAALPSSLIESEIFGHRKGAFTGATHDREGAAVRADGGTLFLDEICEMDIGLQGKLLRFLQTGTVRPLGSDKTREVDVRIVCATNRDPRAEMAEGRLREDLFYRLHVIPIDIPPLRERDEDAAIIADSLLKTLAQTERRSFKRLSPGARARILAYDWPGNVRELQNTLHTSVVMHDGEELTEDMLPPHIRAADPPEDSLGLSRPAAPLNGAPVAPASAGIEPLWKVERRHIEAALDLCGGNVVQAAAKLDVAPSTLYRKLKSWSAPADRQSGTES